MKILLNKGNHKMMVASNTDEVSMVSWVPREVGSTDKFVTGVSTEILGEKEARIFLRKFVRMLKSNGYNLSNQ